jgi:hypothetical protein
VIVEIKSGISSGKVIFDFITTSCFHGKSETQNKDSVKILSRA